MYISLFISHILYMILSFYYKLLFHTHTQKKKIDFFQLWKKSPRNQRDCLSFSVFLSSSCNGAGKFNFDQKAALPFCSLNVICQTQLVSLGTTWVWHMGSANKAGFVPQWVYSGLCQLLSSYFNFTGTVVLTWKHLHHCIAHQGTLHQSTFLAIW